MDREKVIKEWEAVLSRDPLDAPWDLIDDTLALLKEQEAKIEQLNRFVNGFSRDAMPVVRCKDCKHRDPEDRKCDSGHGIQWQLPRQDDWFCADGERKEGR